MAHRSKTDLSATSTTFKALLVKKPICLPSGDQKGYDAPAVPESGIRVVWSSDSNHNVRVPVLSEPTRTTRVPSGEIAGGPYRPLKLNVTPGEGRIASAIG